MIRFTPFAVGAVLLGLSASCPAFAEHAGPDAPTFVFESVPGAPDVIRSGSPLALVGQPVPNVRVERLRGDGGVVGLHELIGEKPVVFQFWTLWCGSCRSDLRVLHDIVRWHGDQVDVYVINVGDSREAIDREMQAPSAFGGREWSIDLPIVLDPNGEAANALGASLIPNTVIVDREGVVRAVAPWRGFAESFREIPLDRELPRMLKGVLQERALPQIAYRPLAPALVESDIERVELDRIEDGMVVWAGMDPSGRFVATQHGDGTLITTDLHAAEGAAPVRTTAFSRLLDFSPLGVSATGEPFVVDAGGWRRRVEVRETRTLTRGGVLLEHGSNTAITLDIDGEPGDEILFGLNARGGVAAYDGDTLLWRNTDNGSVSAIAAADVDPDRSGIELLAVGNASEVTIISRDGETLGRIGGFGSGPRVLAARQPGGPGSPAVFVGWQSGASMLVQALTLDGDVVWSRALRTQSNRPDELRLSPDGEQLAVIVRDRVFAFEAETGESNGFAEHGYVAGAYWLRVDADATEATLHVATQNGLFRWPQR